MGCVLPGDCCCFCGMGFSPSVAGNALCVYPAVCASRLVVAQHELADWDYHGDAYVCDIIHDREMACMGMAAG